MRAGNFKIKGGKKRKSTSRRVVTVSASRKTDQASAYKWVPTSLVDAEGRPLWAKVPKRGFFSIAFMNKLTSKAENRLFPNNKIGYAVGYLLRSFQAGKFEKLSDVTIDSHNEDSAANIRGMLAGGFEAGLPEDAPA